MLMRLFINTLYCLNLAHTVELKLMLEFDLFIK